MTVQMKATVWLTLTCDPSEDEAYKQEWTPFDAQKDIERAIGHGGALVFDKVEVEAEYVTPEAAR